ncbi:helix-turn-helix transcriptional regulator [Salegentibacter sp. F14]
MNFYKNQVLKLTNEIYPRTELNQRIIRAKKFIDLHHSDYIDLEMVCREAALSKYYFIRQFKKMYGCTPYQYLTEVRIAKAKELIRGGMNVRGACFTIGFNSVTSFSSLFKKKTGIPPSAL